MWQQSQFYSEGTINQTTVLFTRLGFPMKREGANMMAEQVETLVTHARSVAKSQNPSRKERTSKSSALTSITCSQWRIHALMHTHTQIKKFTEDPVNFLCADYLCTVMFCYFLLVHPNIKARKYNFFSLKVNFNIRQQQALTTTQKIIKCLKMPKCNSHL